MNKILYDLYQEILYMNKRCKEFQREGSDYQRGYIDALGESIQVILNKQKQLDNLK